MKECFHENPDDRPSFNVLRDSIAQICKDMRQHSPNSSPKIETRKDTKDSIIAYVDMKMKKQYMHMREQNKNQHCMDPFGINLTHEKLKESKDGGCEVEDKNMLQYLSLEDTTPTLYQEHSRTDSRKMFEKYPLSQSSHQRFIMFPNGREESTHYLTYHGSSISKECIPLQNVSGSQSCNPMYYLFEDTKPI